MTTVSPGESYAGLIVFGKVKLPAMPARVTMTVNWNGIGYPFTFQIAKPGTPAPAFKPIEAAAVPRLDAQPVTGEVVPAVDTSVIAPAPIAESRTPLLRASSLVTQ
jgi:hypothetical protein